MVRVHVLIPSRPLLYSLYKNGRYEYYFKRYGVFGTMSKRNNSSFCCFKKKNRISFAFVNQELCHVLYRIRGYLCLFPITWTPPPPILGKKISPIFRVLVYHNRLLQKHRLSSVFSGYLLETNAPKHPLSRENGNTHATLLCLRVGVGVGINYCNTFFFLRRTENVLGFVTFLAAMTWIWIWTKIFMQCTWQPVAAPGGGGTGECRSPPPPPPLSDFLSGLAPKKIQGSCSNIETFWWFCLPP